MWNTEMLKFLIKVKSHFHFSLHLAKTCGAQRVPEGISLSCSPPPPTRFLSISWSHTNSTLSDSYQWKSHVKRHKWRRGKGNSYSKKRLTSTLLSQCEGGSDKSQLGLRDTLSFMLRQKKKIKGHQFTFFAGSLFFPQSAHFPFFPPSFSVSLSLSLCFLICHF